MDPNDELSMDPGPRDSSVLHLQSIHRSDVVWKAGGGDSQRSRCRNPNQARFPKLHDRMIPILSDLMFASVSHLSGIVMDWGLITALIERWRPETHTFHLPVGECSITLQDVSVLLGLRIDGDPVTGLTQLDDRWEKFIEQVFGKALGKSLKGGRLQLSWLTENFESLPDDASDEELKRYMQSYLLQLFAGVLFTYHSGGQIHCMYLPLIQDFGRCQALSWGSVVLAYLFRELCKSCRIGVEKNAGCILLLQLWAWTRLPTLAPIPRGPSLDNKAIWGNRPGPYAMRFTDGSSHIMSTYRLTLDGLGPSHFIWQPYTSDILATLDYCCVDGRSIWCYKCPMICFHIVEPHVANRCLRQFGLIQDIPTNDPYSKELHNIKLQGKQDTNWKFMHRDYISVWDHRVQHVISGDIGDGVVDGYNQWYSRITRLYHTRVGGSHLYAVQLLEHISLVAKGVIDGDMSYIESIANNGTRLLQDQFNHGVFQDFPIEDRRYKEIEIKKKPKNVGHKGGRGGVNAPRRNNEGIHLGDKGHVHDGQVERQHDLDKTSVHLGVGEKSASIEDEAGNRNDKETGNIDQTPPLSHPTFHLLPPSEFQWSPTQQQPHAEQPPHHDDETDNVDQTTPLSHPTFDLLSLSDFQWAPVGQQPLHQQQQVEEHMLHVEKEQHPYVEQHPKVEHVSQELPMQEQRHMQLRPRNNKGTKCGTGGCKHFEHHYKRLRKKY